MWYGAPIVKRNSGVVDWISYTHTDGAKINGGNVANLFKNMPMHD
jgi:hypothetical protein